MYLLHMYITCTQYNYALFSQCFSYQGPKLVPYENVEIWVSWLEINLLFFYKLWDQPHVSVNAAQSMTTKQAEAL